MKKLNLVNKEQAIEMLFDTPPAKLEFLSGGKIKVAQWRTRKSNHTRGKLSGDLADELLEAAGFKVAQDRLYTIPKLEL